MTIKQTVRQLVWNLGYDISRFDSVSSPLARRQKMLSSYKIDLILDVGANTGQFARQMRDLGFRGKIVSFEPLDSACAVLKRNATDDPNWDVIQCALGEESSTMTINVSANSASSSLLDMHPAHAKAAPEKHYIGTETISVRTLDSMFGDIHTAEHNVYMKIDTQGFEHKVIKGAEAAMAHIDTIQLEMSLVPLYDGGLQFCELDALLGEKGYRLVSIEPVFADRSTGQLLQVDGIYHRF